MNFLMLIRSDKDAAGGTQADVDAWVDFDAEVLETGVLIAGAALEPAASSAKVVTPDSGEVVDGPFVAGTPQIEAYYLLDCENLDAALNWALRLPTHGTVEVRPCLQFDLGRDA